MTSKDNQDDKNNDREIIRLSVSEAAKMFGVNSQTVRRALAAGELTYIIVSERYKINFESLVKWSQARTVIRNKSARRGIDQYVAKWKVGNRLYSPNPESALKKKKKKSVSITASKKKSISKPKT